MAVTPGQSLSIVVTTAAPDQSPGIVMATEATSQSLNIVMVAILIQPRQTIVLTTGSRTWR